MNENVQDRIAQGLPGTGERLAFVRSVYLWLTGGFAVAALGALASPVVVRGLFGMFGSFATWVLLGGYLGAFFWAQAVTRRAPINRVAYGVFTFVSGIIAGLAMMAAAAQAGPGVVLTAFAMTAADFLLLTGVAFVTKKDFSFLGSFVIVGLGVALVASLIGIFYHAEIFHLMISAVIVIACSAKILWDTSAMLRAGATGDAAGFALSLFISLLNIFLNLLRLLSGGRRD